MKEICIDTWPGIPTLLELDCKNKKALDNLMIKLDIKDYTMGPIGRKYFYYYLLF